MGAFEELAAEEELLSEIDVIAIGSEEGIDTLEVAHSLELLVGNALSISLDVGETDVEEAKASSLLEGVKVVITLGLGIESVGVSDEIWEAIEEATGLEVVLEDASGCNSDEVDGYEVGTYEDGGADALVESAEEGSM